MKIFSSVVKKIIQVVQAGSGGLTLSETQRKIESFVARISITEVTKKVQDFINFILKPFDTISRLDIYRIPLLSASIIDTEFHKDALKTANISISEGFQNKSDTGKVSVVFDQAGTFNFTVPNGVVGSQVVLEGIGSGGGGGAAVVNGGGGGKGGAYAKKTITATAGQILTCVVPPSSAASAAGAVATVSTGGGNQANIGSQSSTVTNGNNVVSGGKAATEVLEMIFTSFSFIGSSTATGSNSSITIPASTQVGDLIVLVIGNGVNTTPSGYTLLSYIPIDNVKAYLSCYKFATSGDIGSSVVVGDSTNIHNSACSVYRGITSISTKTLTQNQPYQGPLSYAGFSGTTSSRGLFFSYTVSNGAVAATTSTPAAYTRRVESNTLAAGTTSADVTISDAALNAVAGTVLLSARGGAAGGAGSATAGGTGGSTQVGTFVGDVEFTGGNGTNGSLTAGGNGGAGAGSSSNTTGNTAQIQFGLSPTGQGATGATAVAAATTATPYGGGGGGATTAGAASGGSRGAIRISYSI